MHIHGLILLGFIYGVITENCPAKCSCYKNKVNCAGRSLTSLDGYDIHLIQLFDHVDISRNKFTIFPPLEAKFINASKNNFQHFPEIIDGVESVSLRYNQMRDVSSKNCPFSLSSLDLSENPIKTINIDCNGLAVLDLSHCDIEVLPESFFKKLPSLQVLNIGDNPLRKISDLVSFSLQELRIQRTQLRVLKPTVLAGLTNLKFLDLSGNKHMRILDFNTNTEILIAQNCSLESVDFSGMPFLRTAVVDHNVINHIHFLNSLAELHASYNLITHINLNSLKIADLSYNAISTLKLRPMDWLNISGNEIQNLKLVSMRLLEASHCKLKTIETNTYGVKIHTLNISHNELEHFPGGISAAILDVSFNRLSSFKSQIIGIVEIHLSGNRLVLAEDVTAQGKMYLSDNPWTCDCRMDHLYRLAEDPNNLMCAHPKNASGKTWADACYRSKIPRWMLKHPYIPFIISTTVLFLAIFCFYWIKRMLDTPNLPIEEEDNHVVETVLPQIVINDQLPSYEEALLMPGIARKVNVVTQTRSYEVLSRRLSSNSI